MRLEHLNESRKFGTAPVFLTAISTILGAVMFLRFGFAVGNLGLLGTWGVILLGHLVTIPTAMAIAEIATNQRVQGGGEYFIISRSFGNLVGAAVGVALYLSQAISVAFYIIAFGEAFWPVFEIVQTEWNLGPLDPRIVTIPATILLAVLILYKGADLGVKALYIVVATLFASLACFFLGHRTSSLAEGGMHSLVQTVADPKSFFVVFAICFPAFTGMTAGVGLSGDLKDPRRSIPLRLARFVVFAKNWTTQPSLQWADCSATGYHKDTPPWLAVWLLIVADNAMHLAINYGALRWL
jgi:amino acid transporter